MVLGPSRGYYVSHIRRSHGRQWMVRRALAIELVGACAQHPGDGWIGRLGHRLLLEGRALDRVGEILESDRTRSHARAAAAEAWSCNANRASEGLPHNRQRESIRNGVRMRTHLDRALRKLEFFQERDPNFFTD